MARITIQIDTDEKETPIVCYGRQESSFIASGRKIGLLHSGPLNQYLQDAFQQGVGNVQVKDLALNCGYDPGDIDTNKKSKLKNCAVIATAGGNVVFAAIKGKSDNPQFVSLVSPTQPSTSGTNCLGGVVIHSWDSNKKRIDYLTNAPLSFKSQEIYLYYNPNSAMSSDELTDWKSHVGNQVIQFSGANTGTHGNNANGFASDFPAKIPAAAKAIVISSDPFFGASKTSLMAAVNSWLKAKAGRFVVYPLQDYSSAPNNVQPPAGQGSFYGPDLTYAYKQLGIQARQVYDNGQWVDFVTVADVIP